MAKIQLTSDEFGRIEKYLRKKAEIATQINQLTEAHNEAVDFIETAWRDAAQRCKLENPGEVDIIPDLLTEQGALNVKLKPDDRTAEWQDAHDVKRVAVVANEGQTNSE